MFWCHSSPVIKVFIRVVLIPLYLGTEAKPAQTDKKKYMVTNMEKEPFRNTKLQQTLGKFMKLLDANSRALGLDQTYF